MVSGKSRVHLLQQILALGKIRSMFKDLFLFEKVRTKKEAFGFYLAYMLTLFLVFSLLGYLRGIIFPADSSGEAFQRGLRFGAFLAVTSSLILSFLILYKKQLLNNFVCILIAILSGVGAMFGGGLIGLAFTAYLTTKESKASN